MKKVAVVTGLFGNFEKVHYTDCENSYVVTTSKNKEQTNQIVKQGWNVYFVQEEHTNNLVEASRQSKLVKTLKFLKPEAEYILYIDHKWMIMQEHVDKLISLIEGYPLLAFKNNADVYKEFFNSMCFKRYSVDMSRLLTSVKKYEGHNVDMFLTGLMLYDTQHKDFDLILKSFNDSLLNDNHLQCQISFPISIKDVSKTLIKNTLGLRHEYPEPAQAGLNF